MKSYTNKQMVHWYLLIFLSLTQIILILESSLKKIKSCESKMSPVGPILKCSSFETILVVYPVHLKTIRVSIPTPYQLRTEAPVKTPVINHHCSESRFQSRIFDPDPHYQLRTEAPVGRQSTTIIVVRIPIPTTSCERRRL